MVGKMTTNPERNSRWQQFRELDDSIPATPREAAIFLNNAWFHMLASPYSCHEDRGILLAAHGRVNDSFFADSFAEVA
jgi:hypothetical protein